MNNEIDYYELNKQGVVKAFKDKFGLGLPLDRLCDIIAHDPDWGEAAAAVAYTRLSERRWNGRDKSKRYKERLRRYNRKRAARRLFVDDVPSKQNAQEVIAELKTKLEMLTKTLGG